MVSVLCIFTVLLAGLIGGLVNALLSDNGFIWPKYEYCTEAGVKIWRPGVLGNCLVSAVAAFISSGLYGPAATVHLVGETSSAAGSLSLTVGTIAGALLVGVAGARWLTNEVDKNLLRAAATQAATGSGSEKLSQRLAFAQPAEAVSLTNQAMR